MAVSVAASAIGPVMPFTLIHGRASGTGLVSVQLPFVADFVVATVSGANGTVSWANSTTTSGLLKITGISTTTAGVCSFIAGQLA